MKEGENSKEAEMKFINRKESTGNNIHKQTDRQTDRQTPKECCKYNIMELLWSFYIKLLEMILLTDQ